MTNQRQPLLAPGSHSDYSCVLEASGLPIHDFYPWLSVGHSARVQGWKLHLSTVPTQAESLLAKVVPVLASQGVSFKLARSPSILMQMNEGAFGVSQIGKFMTVYPDSDDESRALADQLSLVTAGFEGPKVLTDLQVGDVVYTRFGGFNPISSFDRLGQLTLSVHGADGKEVADEYEIPFRPPHDVPNPFADLDNAPDRDDGVDRLLGPGFLLTDVLHAHPKGSVYRGIDLRSDDNVRAVVIKEGRAHCCADEYGRDMRVRLQRQLQLHRELEPSEISPLADTYFEDDGNGYLILDYLSGATLGASYDRPWGDLETSQQREMLNSLASLSEVVGQLHELGFVHRDLTPTNVFVDTRDKVWLLDLELSHKVGDSEPPIQLGTPGFISPQQRAHQAPAFTDDVYTLGASIIRLLTGRHPNTLLFNGSSNLHERVQGLSGHAPTALVNLVHECISEDASRRPTMTEAHGRLRDCAARHRAHRQSLSPLLETALHRRSTRTLRAGVRGLIEEVAIDNGSGMWLSPSIDGPGSLELLRGANRGVAGVLYVLSRLLRTGVDNSDIRRKAVSAVEWLLSTPPTAVERLPGLHFGECGVAVALAEATVAGVVPSADVSLAIKQAFAGDLDWPDMTHGAAGQGVASLIVADLLSEGSWDEDAHRCAEYLIANQLDEGHWIMPEGVRGLEGEAFYGFAHGAAGIAYFLAAYASRYDHEQAERAWRRAADWLESEAVDPAAPSLSWSWSSRQETVWNYWCHGAPGIGLAFLEFYRTSGEEHYADVARRALGKPPDFSEQVSISQCHGLAGLGEIYLEAAQVLDEPEFRQRAEDISRTLQCLASGPNSKASSWLVEHSSVATADLMVGSGGIVHFLHRMHSPQVFGVPLLPERR